MIRDGADPGVADDIYIYTQHTAFEALRCNLCAQARAGCVGMQEIERPFVRGGGAILARLLSAAAAAAASGTSRWCPPRETSACMQPLADTSHPAVFPRL